MWFSSLVLINFAEDGNRNPNPDFRGANISINGSNIMITCDFLDSSPQSLCVLVYREYDAKTLIVEEYSRDNMPDIITLDRPDRNHTFAIFKKNVSANIDPTPVAINRHTAPSTATPSHKSTNTAKEPFPTVTSKFPHILVGVTCTKLHYVHR